MTYGGRVKDGVIILEGGVHLPEGTPVEVRAPDQEPTDTTGAVSSLLDLAGTIDDLPSDFSREHDHYIHGKPKRNK